MDERESLHGFVLIDYLSIYYLSIIYTAASLERGLLSRGTEVPRQRKRKKESEIGKFKKLKAMIQKRLKTYKNKFCGLGHAV